MQRAQWAARLVVLAAFFDLFAQFPVVAPYARDLGASPTLVGVIVAAYSATNLFGNLGAGIVLDRWGSKRSLVVGLVGAASALALYSVATNPLVLLALRAVHGLAAAVLSPGAFALLGDAAPADQRARAMGSGGAVIALAAVAAFPLAGIGRDRFGSPAVFLGVAALLALAAIVVALTVHEPDVRRSSPVVADGPSDTFFRRRPLQVAYLAAFALNVAVGGLITHLPQLLEVRGEGARASGNAFSIYAVVALLGMAGPAARLSDRFGRQRPLAAGLAVVGAALVILSVAESLPAVYAAAAVFGLGFGVLFPSAAALVADSAGPGERGTAFGIFYAIYSLGVVVGAVASGLLEDLFGTTTTAPFMLGAATTWAVAPFVLAAPLSRAVRPTTVPPAESRP